MDYLLCHEALISPENNANDALLFVEALSWHNTLLSAESRNLKPVLVQINSKLNESKTRREGLLLLNCVLGKVSSQVFIEYCQQWALHLKNISIHDPDVQLRCLSMRIFGELLSLAEKHPEQNRHLASAVIPQFLPQLLNQNEEDDLTVARGLLYFMRLSPGSCRHHSVKIQKRLFEMLSTKNSELVEISSACIAMLPSLSGGERGKTQTASWFDLYYKLCRSLHLELDVLYENLEVADRHAGNDPDDRILFPSTLENADPAAVFLDVYHRVIGICSCLQKLLRVGPTASPAVLMETTLTVVSRILKVVGKAVGSRSTVDKHAVLLYAFLPALHKEALSILESAILSCRNPLLRFDQTILNLFLQTLQWTSTVQLSNDESRQALSKLRGFVYRVFNTWLNVAGAASDLNHQGDGIAKHMLADIRSEEKPAELANVSNAKGKGKKAKRRKLEEPLLAAQASPNLLVDCETCRLALKGLKSIVYTAVDDLKTRTFKELCSKVVSVSLSLRPDKSELAAVIPYGDVGCRVALYELLLSILVAPSAVSYSLLSQGVRIFSQGEKDRSPKVTEICCQGLATCRALTEPIARTLPQGPRDEVRAEIRPETPLSDVEMDAESDSEIPALLHKQRSPPKGVLTNGHMSPPSSSPIVGAEFKKLAELRSKARETRENKLKQELPCLIDLNTSNEVKDGEEAEEIEDDLEKEEEEEEEEMVVEEEVAVKPQVPIPSSNSESMDSNDVSNAVTKDLEAEERDDAAADVSAVEETSTADSILRSFVNSFPDDRDDDDNGQVGENGGQVDGSSD